MITIGFSTRKHDENYNKHLLKTCGYYKKIELIEIVNNGNRSLSECYNEILEKSKNDIVVFLHSDLIIETKQWGNKILKLFDKNPEFGIIGIAGTTDLVNGKWWEIKESMHGKVYHQSEGKKWLSQYSKESYIDNLKEVVCIDGLFFMVHKDRIKEKFDTNFKGFHFYDIPFCVRNYKKGVKIGVTTKFNITHKSIGVTNDQWEENKKQFEDSYIDYLPIRMTNNKTFDEKIEYSKDDIGVGIVTYNAPDRIKQSAMTVPSWVKHFVIVNDGTPYDENIYPKHAHIIQHETNKSVGVAKNSAMKYLLDKGCQHIFIMEDDILIKNENVFDRYIKTSLHTGIKHLNYGLQGPANKKGSQGFNDLNERAQQNNLTDPNPRRIIKYHDDYEIALYPNCVGAFSYYQKEALEKIGLFDDFYKNAWEHVDHTMMAFKHGLTTPYWWFADINKSWEYIEDIEGCIENSTISRSDTWKQNYQNGFIHFTKKHGFGPTQVPDTKPEKVMDMVNFLYSNK